MIRKLDLLLGCCLAALLGACAAPPPDGPTPADLVLTNARVYSFAWGEPDRDGVPAADAPVEDGAWHADAEAVAISDGKIVFVGSAAEADAYRGEGTEVVDLGGAVVLPGLVDSHTHVAGLGASLEQIDLTEVATEEEAVELAAARAEEVPPGTWIVGWGWDEGAWANRYPDLEPLSSRTRDHPVVLRSLHGFAVWGNRSALEAAGIDRDTPTPSGGEIRRDEDDEPTGILLNRATALLTDAIPPPTPEELQERVLRGLQAMAAAGYVTVHDAGVGSELLAAFESLHRQGKLPVRVGVMLSARDQELLRTWLARGPWTAEDGMLTVRSVKAYYDGALGSRGARLLDDYADLPGHRGTSGEEYGFDQDLVTEMIHAGFQTAVHAIGDAGNRETLDFFERAFAGTTQDLGRGGRHRIEHAQVIHLDDFQRFADLGIVASMQPPHAVEDKTWAEDRLGSERIAGAYAWRKLRRTGVEVVFNSDLPGSDHSIFYGLHAAITRRSKDLQPSAGWYPDQALTPEEAVRAYSVWPAHTGFREEDTGLLAPGRWADLTVLDVDPLFLGAAEPEKLLDGSVLLTVVGGKIVHRDLP